MLFKNRTKLFCLLLVLIVCNSKAQQNESGNPNTAVETKSNTLQGLLSADTIPNGQRLTDEAISSYFPEIFIGLEKSGTPRVRDIKTAQPKNNSVQQSYFKNGVNAFILISDWADDSKVINQFNKEQQSEDRDDGFQTVKNYTTPEGLLVTETEQFREGDGKKIRFESRVLLRNARFSITLNSTPKLEGEVVSSETILKSFAESKLPELFNLPIPEIDDTAIQAEEANQFIALDCEVLLPLETVKSICDENNLELVIDSFEKENNCSRSYKYSGSSASLVFLITQYSRSSLSRNVVNVQGNSKSNKDGNIEGLGDAAHFEIAGAGDYFLTVAYKNYSLGLRSFKDRYDKDKCCVCFSKDKLITLAREILSKLD